LLGLSAYVAAKAGLEAFLDTFRKEERQRKITLVRPTAVETHLWHKAPFNLPKNALKPSEVAQQILALHNRGHEATVDIQSNWANGADISG
jgi:short-subunit dehydrogenase